MSTSAENLSKIIAEISTTYNLDTKEIHKVLAEKSLLPKKLLKDNDYVFSTQKAKDFAEQNGIVVSGKGSGKDDKFTISDLKKLAGKPTTTTKDPITPSAKKFAEDSGLSDDEIKNIVGGGQDGRITIKDIKSYISSKNSQIKINISPHAQVIADKHNISNEILQTIQGSGNGGRIVMSDLTEYLSPETDKEPKKKSQKKKEPEPEPESGSDDEEEEDKFPVSDEESDTD